VRATAQIDRSGDGGLHWASGASFANAEITAVGRELDRKLAALLDHLGVGVPDALLAG
jgi:hypothetical protein